MKGKNAPFIKCLFCGSAILKCFLNIMVKLGINKRRISTIKLKKSRQ